MFCGQGRLPIRLLLPISSLSILFFVQKKFQIRSFLNMILLILIFSCNIALGENITEQVNFGFLVARKAPVSGQWQHYQVILCLY